MYQKQVTTADNLIKADMDEVDVDEVSVGEVGMGEIGVDEVGVEATGATGISITLYAFFPADVELVLDEPFLVFIVNRNKKTILFAGKVEDPTKL